jgi:predicted alpha/beta hydrolase
VIPARDGFELHATLYRSADASGRVVIISSATAIPQRFYRHYASALAESGFTALTYDYRGIGASRPASLRGFRADARDWALADMAGVVDWVRSELRPVRLFNVGHSMGGQVPGLLDNGDAIDAMVTVSAQSGYWRLQGAEQKWLVAFHVHVTMPLLTHLVGYMPWSWFGQGEDLPKGVALEWTRWCRNRRYLLGDDTLPLHRFERFSAPVLAYSFDDDNWGTPQAVDAMMSAYPNVERRHIIPSAFGLRSLGHIGYFRPQSQAVWNEGITWLNAQ